MAITIQYTHKHERAQRKQTQRNEGTRKQQNRSGTTTATTKRRKFEYHTNTHSFLNGILLASETINLPINNMLPEAHTQYTRCTFV